MNIGRFRGIFTIPSTPFRETGEIDVESFRRTVDFCVECGAHGLVYPVNASEFFTLSDQERMQLSEVLVDQNAGRLPAIIGVQGVSAEAAAMFASHARDIGADGVIAMPPYVKRVDVSEGAVYDYYTRIAAATKAPVFIQNNMPPIGTNLSASFMNRLCSEVEHVDYIKEETAPSTVKLSAVLSGNDGSCQGVFGGAGGRYLIEEYRRGSAGNMPGCHVTDVMVRFWDALEANEEEHAIEIYKDLASLYFFEHQLPGCYKEVLYRRGVIACPIKRNGNMPLDEVASHYLDEILEALGPMMTWGR